MNNRVNNNNSLHNSALQHVINISKNYIEKFSKEEFNNGRIDQEKLTDLLDRSKNIKVEMDGILNAKISCPLCTFISSAYSVKNSKTGRKWVVSNFLRHYRTHFKCSESKSLASRKSQKEKVPYSIVKFLKKNTADETGSSNTPPNFYTINANSVASTSCATSSAIQYERQFNNHCELQQYIPYEAETSYHHPTKINIISHVIKPANSDQPRIINQSFESDMLNTKQIQDEPELEPEPLLDEFTNSKSTLLQIDEVAEEVTDNYQNSSRGSSPIANEIEVFDAINDLTSDLTNDSSQPDDFFCHGSVASKDVSEKVKPPNEPPKNKLRLFSGSNSRRERSLRNLNELPYNQIQITNFMTVLEEVIDKNPEVTNTLKIITENKSLNKFNYDTKGLLKYLLESAIENSKSKSKNANKFDEAIKRFWLYIFITAGRMTYEILYSNLKNILPSITTIHRQLEEIDNILEGVVRIEDLKLYLVKRKYPPVIFISEDQTALIKKVQYDSSINEMIGFVAPLNKNTGFPCLIKFPVDSICDIEEAFKNESLAINAYIFMAQPLVDGSPAFCISVFGSDNRFTYENVSKRWQYLVKEAEKHDITILGFSSDGDTRCLKSMKILSKLPLISDNPYSPYYQAEFNLENPTVFQDTIHISTKLKTRLLNQNICMNMGGKQVSVESIRKVIENYSRDKHLLCKSFLDSSDKMNFNAIDKISSERVTNLLVEIPDAEATRQYLILTRYILDAFLLKDISIERRIYLIWYATFFMRIWRSWLKKNNQSIQKKFITSNTYTCIELNAHEIILAIEQLRQKQIPEAFLPWLFSSQSCEKIFRETRSMSSTFSTVINYTLLELLRRLKRIQAMHEISTDLGAEFIFPRQENNRLGDDSPSYQINHLPSVELIKHTIEKAKEDAISSARQFGMEMNTECWLNVDLLTEQIPCSTELEEEEELDDSVIDHKNRKIEEKITLETPLESGLPKEDSDFLQYTSKFDNYDSLQLKDFSGQKKIHKSCLAVTLNDGKTRILKKSTLIWFFSEKQGRLSTDRLLRVKGMSLKNIQKKKSGIQLNKTLKNKSKRSGRNSKLSEKQRRKEEDSTSESESDISLASEILSEDFSDLEERSGKTMSNIESISLDSYYAVYYDIQWYLGLVINCKSEKFKMKFLQQDKDIFKWPKKDDIQEVHRRFIFHGPITLCGCDPFTIKRNDLVVINKKYKDFKC
ncbi:uncharacterized protein LOC115880545 [Sitophilus oryzae]|uniref:Uncharacterized protein LOC115880545 n=1 Tax=Sitophilus oryzae TaxID=7048 RepID=A0A6J2XS13_SITOR|nr:uncharacterized protein LOC115880545 [Sitophilus oryzae]